MKFKKLMPELVSGIRKAGYDKDSKEIQGLSIPKIKSGADLFIVAPEGAGKTTALVIGIIQRLKSAFEDVPRAIIMASGKEKVFEIEATFNALGAETDLRIFPVFDEGKLHYQKDMIYKGTDVVVGTPQRLVELMNAMGINTGRINMFAVDDADSMSLNNYGKYIYRFADTFENAQFIIVANRWTDNMKRISERIMKGPQIVRHS